MRQYTHGGDVYRFHPKVDFSANINPLGVPEGVLRAVKESAERISCYPDIQCSKLRCALAQKEGIPEENLIFGNGAAELIYAAVFALRPKRALLLAPGFAEYEQALEAVGCETVFYTLKEASQFLPEDDFLSMITDDTDLVFLCNPNNPTGALLPASFLLRTAKRCLACGAVLILDECFNGFLDEPERYTLRNRLSDFENLLILKAFTKLYAMPGLRLGYGMCADMQLISRMEQMLQPWNVSIAAQAAGTAALAEEIYVERARELVRTERSRLTVRLRKMGLKVFLPSANFLFFKGPSHLAASLLNEGYLIRDCSNYRGLTEGFYRIAVRLPEENDGLCEAMERVLSGPERN